MRAMQAAFAAALLSLLVCGRPAVADVTPLGLWQAIDPDTKQPSGWFLVTQHDGVYDGTLVKMFLGPGDNPNIVCDKCRDDRHNQPWLGLQIIRGMKPDGSNKYDGGTILDPRNGDVYDAMMTVTPDGQTLVVRGFLGISLLGRNEYWTRLPDTYYSQIDPAVRHMLELSNRPNPAVLPPHR